MSRKSQKLNVYAEESCMGDLSLAGERSIHYALNLCSWLVGAGSFLRI